MDLSRFDSPKIWSLIHITIGGSIVFFLIFILSNILRSGFNALLNNFGCLGVVAFEETSTAYRIITFGVVYLPSGFLGGLYIGYKIKENLGIVLAFPGIIGFVILFLISQISGFSNLALLNLTEDVLIPLVGNVIGGYLGGYTMNWLGEGERLEEGEKITLELEK